MSRLEGRMRELESYCAVAVSGDDELLAAACAAVRIMAACLMLGYVAAVLVLVGARS